MTTRLGRTSAGKRREARATTLRATHADAIPTSPPAAARMAASSRNCIRMSRRRAPTAARTPISLVRSTTEISMMFMITIAADDERDRRDEHHHRERRSRDPAPEHLQCLGRDHAERIVGRAADAAHATQEHPHLVLRRSRSRATAPESRCRSIGCRPKSLSYSSIGIHTMLSWVWPRTLPCRSARRRPGAGSRRGSPRGRSGRCRGTACRARPSR